MKNKSNSGQVPVQVLELLPSYVLGLLEAQEKQLVEKALLEFPELQEQLKTEDEMVQYLREEKELFSLSAIEDREERLGGLLKREEFQPQKPKQRISTNTSFIGFFQTLLSGHMSKSQYMGLAAITTLSIALLFAFAIPLFEDKSTFHLASIESGEEKLDKSTVLIGLSVAPDDPRLLKVLDSYNVKTTTIAEKDGMYRLSFTKNKPSEKELKKLLSTLLEQKELIWFAGEAY